MPGSSSLGRGPFLDTGFYLRGQLAGPGFWGIASCIRRWAAMLRISPQHLQRTCGPLRDSLPRRSRSLCWVLMQFYCWMRGSTRPTAIHLMHPLIGIRTPTRRAADVPLSSRARATDIPSTSRASTSRGRARGMPSICQYAGWSDLPTELTGWEYGTPYQIPLEPPRLDHRYISDSDSPPPPREYTEELLGVVASLESMVPRRETLLFAAGVSVPPLQTRSSRPSRGAGRGDSTRSRGRRRAPIRDDEESSEDEESAHPQSETFLGREDDSGSGSESGGDAEEDSEDDSSDSDDGAGRGWCKSCSAEEDEESLLILSPTALMQMFLLYFPFYM
ncbi:uncharacterized protein LOC114291659 [Camellia sinensis]|uniref:uncharacterized protein LOC114291659 n=1 Tax=Camellia sinensis TaxID=4442 RepID=UPI001035F0CD|nr:uncharacterized protein LOC114291659 [Camellia sinensis]